MAYASVRNAEEADVARALLEKSVTTWVLIIGVLASQIDALKSVYN
jgi:hypothetical protein